MNIPKIDLSYTGWLSGLIFSNLVLQGYDDAIASKRAIEMTQVHINNLRDLEHDILNKKRKFLTFWLR